jgi:hypothetical protein
MPAIWSRSACHCGARAAILPRFYQFTATTEPNDHAVMVAVMVNPGCQEIANVDDQ